LPKNLPKDILRKEFLSVIKTLGLKDENYILHHFKVRNLHEKRQEILEELIKIRDKFNPDLVITPSLKDFHQDHQIVANEAIRAFKKHSSIIGYELPWNHIAFDTTLFVKLDETHIEKKHKLLQNYNSQILLNRDYFSKEHVFGLAKVRGTQCNSDYAEAFEVIRWVIN
ncbi:MAG: PIG-L family deacetylase, partial [Candidatus Aenigmarchaeota archaeon]|nr:PIG-L family deacetylase [Candidatus Aenigmarchaeota archaeon]